MPHVPSDAGKSGLKQTSNYKTAALRSNVVSQGRTPRTDDVFDEVSLSPHFRNFPLGQTIHLRNNLSLQLQKRRWRSDGMELRVRGWDLNADSGVTFIWENVGNITDLLLCAPSTSHHNHSSLHHSTSILSLSKLDGS